MDGERDDCITTSQPHFTSSTAVLEAGGTFQSNTPGTSNHTEAPEIRGGTSFQSGVQGRHRQRAGPELENSMHKTQCTFRSRFQRGRYRIVGVFHRENVSRSWNPTHAHTHPRNSRERIEALITYVLETGGGEVSPPQRTQGVWAL